MKTIRVLNSIICSLLLLTFVACDQDNLREEYLPENQSLSFSGTNTALNALPTETEIFYNILRGNTDGRLELPIQTICDPAIFTLPTTVVFEDGSGIGRLRIPLENTELGVVYPITVQFEKNQNAVAGKDSVVLAVMRDYNWGTTDGSGAPSKTGYWTDGIVPAGYNVPSLTYPVQVQEALEAPGLYRMINPYGAGVWPYAVTRPRNPHYMYIDTRDPDKVVIDRGGLLGIIVDAQYGELLTGNYAPGGEMRYGNKVGTTITFPAGTLALAEVLYNNGAWFALCFETVLELGTPTPPPPPPPNYSAEVTFTGRFTNTSGKDFAMGSVRLGADVEYAVVAVVPGDVSAAIEDDDLDDILAGIEDGTIESIEIEASGNIQLPCGPGINTFVVITYADEEAKEVAYVTFVFPPIDINPEDFYGDYIMTGTSVFSGGAPANMPITIEAGEADNTFAISGIYWEGDLTATFNPVNGTLVIAPQDLEDFWDDEYEETVTNVQLLSVVPPSTFDHPSATMVFALGSDGIITLASETEAVGYVIWGDDELGDTWPYSGYHSLVFTPDAGGEKKSTLKPNKDNNLRKVVSKTVNKPESFNQKQGSFSIGHKTVFERQVNRSL